jgi:hypothetical protein
LGRPRNNQPFRVVRVELLPCEDRSAVFTACIRRVLESAPEAPQPALPNSEREQIGEDECRT